VPPIKLFLLKFRSLRLSVSKIRERSANCQAEFRTALRSTRHTEQNELSSLARVKSRLCSVSKGPMITIKRRTVLWVVRVRTAHLAIF